MSIAVPNPWIISRKQDLLWFQGSVLAGVALLVVFALAPALSTNSYVPDNYVLMVLFLWGALFDGTHVWGTYARSYLAPDASSRSALPGSWSWLVLLLGPAIALLDYYFCAPGPSLLASAGWLFRGFLMFAYLWAYWHLVRQHYGFLVLYRRRSALSDSRGAKLDTLLLWAGCLYPYLRFTLTPAYAESGLPLLVPADWCAAARLALDLGTLGIFTVLLALMISGRYEPFRFGPKHLFLGIVILFHLVVFAWLDNLLTITATLTIFHNLQYHRIVWQYERGQGRTPSGGLTPYLALGIMLGVAWYGPRILGVACTDQDLLRNLLIGFGWSVAMHHYLVDGCIWRVRRQREVAQTLDAGALSH